MFSLKKNTVIPGFGLTLGFTVFYLSVLVLIPLGALFLRASHMEWDALVALATSPRTLAAFKLSFGASLIAATVNAFFGLIVAWALVRYRFPGRSLIDLMIDLPFALPTAVAGIALTSLYSQNGWVGGWLEKVGIKGAFSPFGVVVALIFIGFPFVVRTLQPVIKDLDPALEEAALCLGANTRQTFFKVIFPVLVPALLTGFTLAFARAVGEYGSVVFISGNMPGQTEIAPLLIVSKLEQYDYVGATVIAAMMLVCSFLLLLTINTLQWWRQNKQSEN